MATYLNKWEKWVNPQDGRNTAGQYTPSAHGTSGPIQVSLPNYNFDADHLLITAASQVPGFPYSMSLFL